MLGNMAHAFLGLLALGDIGQNPDVVGWLVAVRVVNSANADAGWQVFTIFSGDSQLTMPGAAGREFFLKSVGALPMRQVDQSKHRVTEQLERLVARHQRGGWVDRKNAVRFVGQDNAGWRVIEDLLRQLFAFGAHPAFSDIGIDRYEATVGQWYAANIERFAVGPGSLDMVRFRFVGAR